MMASIGVVGKGWLPEPKWVQPPARAIIEIVLTERLLNA
jgi:hypothetical protein